MSWIILDRKFGGGSGKENMEKPNTLEFVKTLNLIPLAVPSARTSSVVAVVSSAGEAGKTSPITKTSVIKAKKKKPSF